MQVQQLNEINVSSVGQLDAHKTTKSKAVDTADTQQNSAFDDHLDEQIEHTKKSENKQEVIEKQTVSDADRNEESIDNTPQAKREQEALDNHELSELEQQRTTASLEEVNESELNVAHTIDLNVLAVKGKHADALPVEGNMLPLTEQLDPVISQALQAEVDNESRQPVSSGIEVLSPIVDVLNKSKLQAGEKISTQPGKPSVITNQTLAAAQLNYVVSPAEKNSIQGRQAMPVASEVPTAEVITQAARMQSIPLSTEVSSKLNSSQNLNVLNASAVTEVNSLVNAPATMSQSLGNTLSSTITTAVQNPQWSQQVKEQISFMVKGGFQQAEIKLNPAHLGPMEIKLVINDDQASVSFVAQHAVVRDALDTAMPRLREMLEQQGLNLADADVSTQSQQKQAQKEAQNQADVDTLEADGQAMENETGAQKIMSNMEVDSALSIYA